MEWYHPVELGEDTDLSVCAQDFAGSHIEPWEFLQNAKISCYIRGAALLILNEFIQYQCNIVLPYEWLQISRDQNYLNSLNEAQLFFQLLSPIDNGNFRKKRHIKGVDEMLNLINTPIPFNHIYCTFDPDARSQQGYELFLQLYTLPMKMMLHKNNLSQKIPLFNNLAIESIKAILIDYINFIFKLNNTSNVSNFLKNYLIISTYNPEKYLVTRESHRRQSYNQIIQQISRSKQSSFNKDHFIIEIVSCQINLWCCFEIQQPQLTKIFQIDTSTIRTDRGYYQFASKLAMFIELARIHYRSWTET